MEPIAISLHNRSDADRHEQPVAIGVPFTRGQFKELPAFVVTLPDGERLPTQVHHLLSWDDDSVKFALVQFPATVPARATGRVHLRVGRPPDPPEPCRLEVFSDRLEIDTGPARFTVRKGTTAGIDRAVIDGQEILGGPTSANFFIVEVGEKTGHLLGEIEEIDIEERGPLRVLVRVRGAMKPPPGSPDHFRFELALMAYAGQRALRAQYTFIALDHQDIYPVERLGLRLYFANTEPVAYRVDTSEGPREGVWDTGTFCALHAFRGMDGSRFFVAGHKQPLASGKDLPGRASFRAAQSTVGVAVREFSQNGPGGFRLGWDKSQVTAEVRFYDGTQRTLRLGAGRSRTHDVLWCFAGPGGDAAAMHRELAAFQAPVIPAPDPVYFCQTGAFGPLRAAGEGVFAEFDRSIRAGFDAWQREMAADPRNFGMMNYGDFFSVEAYGAQVGIYMDEEYDPAHGLYLLFARSGDPDYFEAAGRLVRHFIDVDVHQLTGHQSFHGYLPRVERHEENIMEHGTDWGHIFNDSAIDYYLLTGDRRALRIACAIAEIACAAAGDAADGPLGPRYVFKGAERTFGWPVITMVRAYEVTRDARYVEAIERILNYLGRFAVDPWKEYAEGGWWWRTMMHDGCKPFMLGLVFEGFCQYHQVSRKPQVIEVLTTIADWMIANMWNDERGKFEYEFNAYNPGHRAFAVDDLLALPLAYLYRATKNPVYQHVLRKMAGPQATRFTSGQGKEFGMVSRSSPHFLALYEPTLDDQLGPVGPFRNYTRTRAKPLPEMRPFETMLLARLDGDLRAEVGGTTIEPRLHGTPGWVEGKDSRKAAYFGLDGPRHNQPGGLKNLAVPDHAAYPCAADTLLAWGAAGVWVRHDEDMREPRDPAPRPLLYLRGKRPKRDSLLLAFIYNELRVRLYDSNGWLCGAAESVLADLAPGTWHHYAVAWQPEGLCLYVDGDRRSTDTDAVLPDGEQTEVVIGWCDGNWCGCMDYAGLWLSRGAVAAEEIRTAQKETE